MRKKIIMGTAAMGRLNSASAIRNFIAKCVTAGFTSFDTAPLYGSGVMEGILARALDEVNPQQPISINTKFGLYPPLSLSILNRAYFCKKSALALLKRVPGASNYGRNRAPLLETARKSLNHSVRKFGEGRIDVFFAHEIPIAELMSTPFLDFIRDSKQNGSFKRFGLGGYRSQYSSGGNDEFWDCVDVIQVESQPDRLCPRPSGWDGSIFLHGVLSSLKKNDAAATSSNAIRTLLAEALQVQGADRVVIGVSRENHLNELIDALADPCHA